MTIINGRSLNNSTVTPSINEIEKFYKSILEQVLSEDNEPFIPIQSDKTFTPISTDEIDEAKKNWTHNKQSTVNPILFLGFNI